MKIWKYKKKNEKLIQWLFSVYNKMFYNTKNELRIKAPAIWNANECWEHWFKKYLDGDNKQTGVFRFLSMDTMTRNHLMPIHFSMVLYMLLYLNKFSGFARMSDTFSVALPFNWSQHERTDGGENIRFYGFLSKSLTHKKKLFVLLCWKNVCTHTHTPKSSNLMCVCVFCCLHFDHGI